MRERGASDLTALLGASDPNALLARLEEHRLTPLAALRWADEELPEPLRHVLTRDLEGTRGRALALQALGTEAVEAISTGGVRCLPLKGPWLSQRAFGDRGARAVNDIDLLVAEEDLDGATERLSQLGYRVSEGWPSEIHRTLRAGVGLPRIELHWRVHWYENDFARSMLEHAETRGGHLCATTEDELLGLLLFYSRDGFYGLRGVADIAALCDREPIGAALLAERIARFPQLATAAYAAAMVARSVVGVELPNLASRPRAKLHLGAALANPDAYGELDQAATDIRLIDVLLAPRDQRLAALRRHLVPHPAEIRSIYGIDDRRLAGPLLLASRAARVFQTGLRLLAGFWKAARRGRSRVGRAGA